MKTMHGLVQMPVREEVHDFVHVHELEHVHELAHEQEEQVHEKEEHALPLAE